MRTPLIRAASTCFGIALLSAIAIEVPAQDISNDSDRTFQLLKAPQTPEELWDAVVFSMNVGKADQAAEYLDRLLASNPPPELLIRIRERDAIRVFPKFAASPELYEKGKALLRMTEEAARARARDPQRIAMFIDYLSRSPRHRSYAIGQLRAAGADAVPYLLAALRDPSRRDQHTEIFLAMQQLDRSAAPPLIAALAVEDRSLLIDIVQVLGVLGDPDAVPPLRVIAEASQAPPQLQALARTAVERILQKPYAELPSAIEAITEQANRYYEHQANLRASSEGKVRLWQWVPNEGLKSEEVTVSYAEEHFALMNARMALALDPAYEPAQIVLLSVALEKATERVGIDQPLPEGPGRASAEALAAGPELLSKVLTRALESGRSAVALGAVRALGQVASLSALASQAGRPSPLVAALTAPDRRLQFAAAEAILNLRPQQPYPGTSQIVPILANALVADSTPRALVIDPDTTRAGALTSLLEEAGYRTQFVGNAREGFPIAAESSNYELILIDPNIYEPNLTPALAMFRSDPRTAGIPIVLLGDPSLKDELEKFERRYSRVKVFLRPTTIEMLKVQLDPLVANRKSKPLTAAERAAQARIAASWLARAARGEVRGIDLRPAEQALLSVIDSEELGPDALVAVSFLPSARSQSALAQLALNDAQVMPLRVEAARQLRDSIRRFGSLLDQGEKAALVELLDRTSDPTLHQALAGAVGASRERPASTGEHLRRFPTPPFEPPAESGEQQRPAEPAAEPQQNS